MTALERNQEEREDAVKTIRMRRLILLGSCAALIGCGYTTRGMFPENISTVNVPIFSNDSGFRRDIEFLMTERVIQAIEQRTPFKVVSGPNADTTLVGRITGYYKNPFGEDGRDNPRGGLMIAQVQIQWIDNRTGRVLNQLDTTDPGFINLFSNAPYTINTAESNATADLDLVDDIADQIVSMMHAPW